MKVVIIDRDVVYVFEFEERERLKVDNMEVFLKLCVENENFLFEKEDEIFRK